MIEETKKIWKKVFSDCQKTFCEYLGDFIFCDSVCEDCFHRIEAEREWVIE